MALDRHTIEKKDFPLGRRGYDPAAVDAHLSTIADEVETSQQRAGRAEPVATAISEQVRGIVEAAEKGANEIEARAQEEAREIKSEATRAAKRERQQAARDAKRQREEAAQQARDYVEKVSQSTSQMLERLQTIDGELSGLTASLRDGTERLNEELARLEGELESLSVASSGEEAEEGAFGGGLEGGLGSAATEQSPAAAGLASAADEPVAVAAEPVPAGAEPVPAGAEAVPAGDGLSVAPDEAQPADESAKLGDRQAEEIGEPESEAALDVPAPAPADVSDSSFEEPAAAGDESEGARLIALNMALNGTPRDETDRYLAENFTLDNRESLLDEVYASVDG